VSFGKSCWWVLFGLRPLFCVWFAAFRFDETQIWLGDLRVVFSFLFALFVVVRCDLPALLGLLGPCTNSFLTAYTHVRTEPQCDIGQTRGKKTKKVNITNGRNCTSEIGPCNLFGTAVVNSCTVRLLDFGGIVGAQSETLQQLSDRPNNVNSQIGCSLQTSAAPLRRIHPPYPQGTGRVGI